VKVEVHLFADLSRYLPAGVAAVELPDGVSVADLAQHLAIPDDLPRLTLVNGQDAPPDRRLAPGDVVDILPPLAGG